MAYTIKDEYGQKIRSFQNYKQAVVFKLQCSPNSTITNE